MAQSTLRPAGDRHFRKTERIYIGIGIKLLGAVLLLAALGWGARHTFLLLQERRLMKQARLSIEKKDERWAVIAARRVFELNPKNADACRVLAEAMEEQGQAGAVEWRRRVVAIEPNSIDDAVRLAKTALRFGQVAVAEQALQKVEAKGADRPLFHQVKGELATAKKDFSAAETEFAAAVRLDPGNKSFQLALAARQLQSASAEQRAGAKDLLRQLTEDPQLRAAAARALRDGALEQKDAQGAFTAARLLASFPEADFRERLYYLQMLRQLKHPDFAVALLDAENEAAGNPTRIFELLSWMSGSQLQLLALDWMKQLPVETLSKGPVAAAVAECYAAAKEWPALEEWCRKSEWGGLDFLRHAFVARAAKGQDRELDAEREWNIAKKAANADGEKISALQRKAAAWEWKAESLEMLWQLSKDAARQSAALTTLRQYYVAEGDTAGLYRVAAKLAELHPEDPESQNDLAQLGLLLNFDRRRAAEIARTLHEQSPSNPAFASTYAYSLFAEGEYSKALEALSALNEQQLREPAVAAYYGVFLAANGDKARAREFLTLGEAATLLPEERVLLDRAAATIPSH